MASKRSQHCSKVLPTQTGDDYQNSIASSPRHYKPFDSVQSKCEPSHWQHRGSTLTTKVNTEHLAVSVEDSLQQASIQSRQRTQHISRRPLILESQPVTYDMSNQLGAPPQTSVPLTYRSTEHVPIKTQLLSSPRRIQIAPSINFQRKVRLTSNELDQQPEHVWRQLAWNSVSNTNFKPGLIAETKKKLCDLINNIDSPTQDQAKVIEQLRNIDKFDPKLDKPRKITQAARKPDDLFSLKDTFRQFQFNRKQNTQAGKTLSCEQQAQLFCDQENFYRAKFMKSHNKKATLPDYLLNFKELSSLPSSELLNLYLQGYYKLDREDIMLKKMRIFAQMNQTEELFNEMQNFGVVSVWNQFEVREQQKLEKEIQEILRQKLIDAVGDLIKLNRQKNKERANLFRQTMRTRKKLKRRDESESKWPSTEIKENQSINVQDGQRTFTQNSASFIVEKPFAYECKQYQLGEVTRTPRYRTLYDTKCWEGVEKTETEKRNRAIDEDRRSIENFLNETDEESRFVMNTFETDDTCLFDKTLWMSENLGKIQSAFKQGEANNLENFLCPAQVKASTFESYDDSVIVKNCMKDKPKKVWKPSKFRMRRGFVLE